MYWHPGDLLKAALAVLLRSGPQVPSLRGRRLPERQDIVELRHLEDSLHVARPWDDRELELAAPSPLIEVDDDPEAGGVDEVHSPRSSRKRSISSASNSWLSSDSTRSTPVMSNSPKILSSASEPSVRRSKRNSSSTEGGLPARRAPLTARPPPHAIARHREDALVAARRLHLGVTAPATGQLDGQADVLSVGEPH